MNPLSMWENSNIYDRQSEFRIMLRKKLITNWIQGIATTIQFTIFCFPDSVVSWGIVLQAGRTQVRFPIMSLDFSIDLIL
jgi:hypothetical protein